MIKGNILTYNQILSLGDEPLIYLTYLDRDGSHYKACSGYGILDVENNRVIKFVREQGKHKEIGIIGNLLIDNPTTPIDEFRNNEYKFTISEALDDVRAKLDAKPSKNQGIDFIITTMAHNYSEKIGDKNQNIISAYKQGVLDILEGNGILTPESAIECFAEARKEANMSPVNKDYKRLLESFTKLINKK